MSLFRHTGLQEIGTTHHIEDAWGKQRTVHLRALLFHAHDTDVPQLGEVLRSSRFMQPQVLGQFADTPRPRSQSFHHRKTHGVSQHSQVSGSLLKPSVIKSFHATRVAIFGNVVNGID
jgi:hypothetical protein